MGGLRVTRALETCSMDLVTGSFMVTGTVTASRFFGENEGEISYVGSASFSPKAGSSSFALTASNVGPGGIISGAQLVIADVAPTVLGLNSTLGSFTNLTGIDETIDELGDGLTRLKIALDDYNEARISVAMTTVDDKGALPQLAPQWSVDEVVWDFFAADSASAGAPLTASNVTAESPFTAMVSESKQDIFMRVVTFDGPSSGPGATAKIGAIFVSFR